MCFNYISHLISQFNVDLYAPIILATLGIDLKVLNHASTVYQLSGKSAMNLIK